NTDKIGVWGSSAGGHLAMMVGCADEDTGMEGDGGWEEYSSRVQAVCSFFGPSDLTSLFMPDGCCDFIGETLESRIDLYTAASPINYVSAGDPPLLMIHGSADYVVPYGQSEEMRRAYKDAGLDVELVRVVGAGHGFFPGDDFTPTVDEIEQKTLDFFAEYLLSEE
ncbi:MAG: prolyl oligopeptidase family serine peptidase, partial [Chloroflexota bacterium]